MNELAGTIGLCLPVLCYLAYRLWADYRERHRRADRFYLWAMMIGQRIDWSKVPPIVEARIQHGHIVDAHIQPFAPPQERQ